MPRTVAEEIRNEAEGRVRGTAEKRGSGEVYRFEDESPEAQAKLLRLFPYLREQRSNRG